MDGVPASWTRLNLLFLDLLLGKLYVASLFLYVVICPGF